MPSSQNKAGAPLQEYSPLFDACGQFCLKVEQLEKSYLSLVIKDYVFLVIQ